MATKKPTEQKSSAVKVRVLVDCAIGRCNAVAVIDAKDLPALAGLVDSHPDAVAYAESLAE